MLKLFNSLGNKTETFNPPHSQVVNIFTCGPSIYQKAHIGNFRTFLFEDILVRYLEYVGYRVKRGMNFTDIEGKAIDEAKKRKIDVERLTEENIDEFLKEMHLLKMKIPEYLPKASESVGEAVQIIKLLVETGIAYWHRGNVYFDPLKFPGFGKLFGLDMTKWPRQKRRFHKDTYPGMQWNLGDFILWHGDEKRESVFWDTEIGRGRPAWNIQDPAMIRPYFRETLAIYCGGIDNLYRHHDYTLAVLESITNYPLAKFWLHGQHLSVNGQKMSKSKGNVFYTDTLLRQSYTAAEIRFFLIYGHYRTRLNYSPGAMVKATVKLRGLKNIISQIEKKTAGESKPDAKIARQIKEIFSAGMDSDLNVREALDG
ncbi:MAG: class I tRNA ligase family protein, partial [Deltaproteobacteria bacterium]|nr:class I tRNA ligase family protein [Deltaproteobacteria bacterium]